MKSYLMVIGMVCLLVRGTALEGATNVASSGTAKASSEHSKRYDAAKAIDGKIDDDHRWVSRDGSGPHTLVLELSAEFTISGAHIYTGFHAEDPVRDMKLEAWVGGRWVAIPGASVKGNDKIALAMRFDKPVTTTRVRFVGYDKRVRVKELLLWLRDRDGVPPLGTGVSGGPVAPPQLDRHHVFVNQVGYDTDGPKRFTAPNSPDGSGFVVREVDGSEALFEGQVVGGVGDFTMFLPEPGETEYVIEVSGGGLKSATSYDFQINPLHMERLVLEPALRFMVDARSMTGTHPSAYGGTPWRDGVYYTHEMPSLVQMYLAHPAFFDRAEVEIGWAEDKARVLSPNYVWVRAAIDKDVMRSTQRYFTELDGPVGKDVPDVVQMIHWTVGMYLMDPVTKDPSDRGGKEIIHPQTVEQFAFFLYAHPYMERYFTRAFYDRAEAFTVEQWEKVGLFEVIETVGDAKGRYAPGHSVMPNLLMYAVAKREGWANADRYLDAAVAQAKWVIETFEADDVRVGKGQRMSEHKTITGLTMLQRVYPSHAPDGLATWLEDWQRGVIAASDNLYDFRKYSDTEWTLPKPWNEPGNIAGLPGLIDAVWLAVGVEDERMARRLVEIRTSHIDNLFGRNPMNATSSQRGAVDFEGIDSVWPKKFHEDWCARLELVRGTLNSNAASEHYPHSPQNGFRHCEGWTAFNAAWNVTLAYRCRAETWFTVSDEKGGAIDFVRPGRAMRLGLRAILNQDPDTAETITIWTDSDGERGALELVESDTNALTHVVDVDTDGLGLKRGKDGIVGYGYGFMAKTLRFRWDAERGGWSVQQGR